MFKIDIGQRVLSENEKYAQQNSEYFRSKNKLCLNMISSPGSGKTTILTRTVTALAGKLRIGVIEGDIQTELDAQRIRAANAPAVQIETGGACHLSAQQIADALKKLPEDLQVIIIENVGNLVCPSAFELGESTKIAVLSVAEGDDKPAKYPSIFARSKAAIINKIDLLPYVDFDLEKVKADILKLNPHCKIFPLSAKTLEGFDHWLTWLQNSFTDLQK